MAVLSKGYMMTTYSNIGPREKVTSHANFLWAMPPLLRLPVRYFARSVAKSTVFYPPWPKACGLIASGTKAALFYHLGPCTWRKRERKMQKSRRDTGDKRRRGVRNVADDDAGRGRQQGRKGQVQKNGTVWGGGRGGRGRDTPEVLSKTSQQER